MLGSQEATQTFKMLKEAFESDITKDFIKSVAKLTAIYYFTLIEEGVPADAAALIAANWKPSGTE